MIDINPEIFSMNEKKFVLKAFSEEYSSHIDISFDDLEEFEAATVGLSLKFRSLKKAGQIIPINDEAHFKYLMIMPS